MNRLIEIMALLRSPKGCPWDREQTHRSLKPYIIEEAYELLEAIDHATDNQGDDGLVEELGDLLLQVVFHSQIASETGRFQFDDVVESICQKLIRRHPHVFESRTTMDTNDVVKSWDAIKKQERGTEHTPTSLLDGIPQGLPALSLAREVQRRAAKVGFEWDQVDGALDKVAEEAAEILAVQQEPSENQAKRLEEEWGDLFFAMVNVARYCAVDPESALFGAANRFQSRFQHIEREAQRQGKSLESMDLNEMDVLWDEAKQNEAKPAK